MPPRVDFYIEKKKVETVSLFSFQSVAQAGLEHTLYLWQALILDPSASASCVSGLKAGASSTVRCLFPGLAANSRLHSHMGLYVKLELDLSKSFQ